MTDQPGDPADLRWHPTRHYDVAMVALGEMPTENDPFAGVSLSDRVLLAVAHGLLGLVMTEMQRASRSAGGAWS